MIVAGVRVSDKYLHRHLHHLVDDMDYTIRALNVRHDHLCLLVATVLVKPKVNPGLFLIYNILEKFEI